MILLASALLVALGTAPASAAEQTVPVAEAAEDLAGHPFVDNAALIDPRPLPIEFFGRSAADNQLRLFFTTGSPQCYGVHASVYETPEAVTVDLLGGTPPEAVGKHCIMIALTGTLDIALASPLGDRAVLTTRLDKPD